MSFSPVSEWKEENVSTVDQRIVDKLVLAWDGEVLPASSSKPNWNDSALLLER